MCRARAARRASPRSSSCRPTRRRSGRARRRSRPTTRSASISRIIRTARRPTLREAIGRAFGLDPDRIVCGAGSDDLLNLLARAYLADGDEAIHTTHGFLVYPIATLGAGATPVVAPEKDYTADVDAILARGDAERTKIVFLANPNNPTGTYVPFDEVKRLHARPAAACAAGARRRLCRIRAAQRLRVRHRAGRDHRERRDDAHVLEDPRPRRAAARLDVRAGARRRRAQPHPRAVQRQRAGDRGRHRGDRRRRACQERSREHNDEWLAWLTEEIGKLGLKVTPSVAQFRADPFPETKGRTAEDADAFLTKRGLILRRVGAYKLPNALRMTVGTEEANRLVVDALAEFLGQDGVS